MVKSPPVINRRRKRKNDELAEEDRASELLNKAVGHMDSVRRNMAVTKSMDDCSAFGINVAESLRLIRHDQTRALCKLKIQELLYKFQFQTPDPELFPTTQHQPSQSAFQPIWSNPYQSPHQPPTQPTPYQAPTQSVSYQPPNQPTPYQTLAQSTSYQPPNQGTSYQHQAVGFHQQPADTPYQQKTYTNLNPPQSQTSPYQASPMSSSQPQPTSNKSPQPSTSKQLQPGERLFNVPDISD